MTANNYLVKKAVWGNRPSTNPPSAHEAYVVTDITAQLQSILDGGATSFKFDGQGIPDPLPGVPKGWAILININGKDYYYAGTDFDTVDFTQLPTNPVGRSKLSVSDVSATLVSGGWPTPEANYLFSACTFTITNNTGKSYPTTGTPWVSVDCYASTSNSPSQDLGQLVSIGDIPVNVGTLPIGGHIPVNVASLRYGLFNMGRTYTGNPTLLKSEAYYLYIQVRDPSGLLLHEGGFSEGTFTPQPPQ